jgi:hypothetical protein
MSSVLIEAKVNFNYRHEAPLEFLVLEVMYGYERYTTIINLVYDFQKYPHKFNSKVEFKNAILLNIGSAKLEYNQITNEIFVFIDEVRFVLEHDKNYKFPLRQHIIEMRTQISELKKQLEEIKTLLN